MSIDLTAHADNICSLTSVVREFYFESVDSPLPGFSGSDIQIHIPLESRRLRNMFSLLNE